MATANIPVTATYTLVVGAIRAKVGEWASEKAKP